MSRGIDREPFPAIASESDASVVAAVLDGQTERFATLVQRYQEDLFRFACGMTGSPDSAADIVQDSFVKAYESLRSCRDPERFAAWLHRIVRNRCLDSLKRNRRQVSLGHAADYTQEPATPGVPGVERFEIQALLETALAKIPPAQREAFLMKHLEDRPYEEMAEMLGTSVSALKMRVKRAREALQALLGAQLSL